MGPYLTSREQHGQMPSLFRFLIAVGILGGVVFGGLYVLAEYFEPAQKETSSPVSNVKIRR
jgi:hypothetical protein